MSNILIDVVGGQVVMLWSDLDNVDQHPKVFVRYAHGDIRSCPEWMHDGGKHIDETLTEADLFCDHCEENFGPDELIHEENGKWCKHCHDYLAAVAEIEADIAEERRAEAKGAEV